MTSRSGQPTGIFREALERGKARWERWGEVRYLRLCEDLHGLPKGSVLLGGRLIPGYPHIGRIFRLEQGLRQQFPGGFWVEEKIDGYNVRVLRHGDDVLALSRGGYVCPFSSDRIGDLVDLRILERMPDLVLCVEIAGPDNPYAIGSPPFVERDVQGFVFDMLRDHGTGFLAQQERLDLVDRYGLPAPRCFGRFAAEQWRDVLDIARDLDAAGREGVVLKAEAPNQHRTKFVTLSSGIYDIRVRAADMAELPGEYFTGRILRMALFMDEAGMAPDEQVHRRLGQALLEGLFESIETFKRQGRAVHRFRCRFRQRSNAEAFLQHLRATLGHTHLRVERLASEGDLWLLEFDKEVPKLSGLFEQLFRGDALVD